jgi:hypothetical protein
VIRIYAANDSNVLTDISQYVNLQTPGVISVTENAEEQSVATASVEFEDPTGALDLVGLRDIVIDDDLASFARLFRGQLAERHIRRGNFRAGALARTWTAGLNDLNTRLAWPNLESSAANRPAETDVARMSWLITTVAITDICQDTSTYFDTTNPVAMDAVDYRGQPMASLISDCLLAAVNFHKNCYLLNVAGGSSGYQVALWYGSADLTTFSSSIQISNVLADVDGTTTFAPYVDAELVRSPERVFSELHTNYDGGSIAQTRSATYAQFFATRGTIYDAVNVKSSTTAASRGLAQLEVMATEDDVVTCTILVPSSKVNSVRVGMRIQAKFSHLVFSSSGTSYNAYTWFRVLNRTVTLVSPPDATGSSLYSVFLTLSPPTPTPPAPSCTTELAGLVVTENGPHFHTTVIDTPPAPIALPSIIIGGFGGGSDTGGQVYGLSNTDYTQLDDLGGANLFVLTCYRAQSAAGTPPPFLFGETLPDPPYGGAQGYTYLFTSFATSATSPVQQAAQLGGGATLTFPGSVTAGNIIIAFSLDSLNKSSSPRDLSIHGWTLLYMSDGAGSGFDTGGVTSVGFGMWARCALGGDGATYAVGDASFPHYTWASEWAIT